MLATCVWYHSCTNKSTRCYFRHYFQSYLIRHYDSVKQTYDPATQYLPNLNSKIWNHVLRNSSLRGFNLWSKNDTWHGTLVVCKNKGNLILILKINENNHDNKLINFLYKEAMSRLVINSYGDNILVKTQLAGK